MRLRPTIRSNTVTCSARGLPIATGVIEGACRHLFKEMSTLPISFCPGR